MKLVFETKEAFRTVIFIRQSLNGWLFLALIIFLPSCRYLHKKTTEKNEDPIARVEDAYLYNSDIESILKSAGGAKDSASIVHAYVDEWVKRKLMIQKALLYLPPEKLNIDRQVEDYRESLILYLYEKELILQKLDTVVEESALLKYFDEYKTNFELKSDVVQMYYVKAPGDAPKIDSLVIWMASRKDADRNKLQDYCHQYASDFSLNDSSWYEMSSVQKNIPISRNQLEIVSLYRTTAMVSDSVFNYVVKVNDYKAKGTIAPFDFVKNDITRIILNKRKKELVRSTYENVYLEGKRNNTVEVYHE